MFNRMKAGLFATAAAGVMIMSVSAASADPLPFQVDPDALATGGPYANVTATDLNGQSDATIRQVTANSQTETGWLQIQSLTNNGVDVSTPARLCKTGAIGCSGSTAAYDIYVLFQGTVNGITGFSAGQTGIVNPGDYVFAMYADIGLDDTFNPGTTNAAGGTTPTVGGTTGNDVLLAVGTSLAGSVGFAPVTGAPFFNVVANFVLCDGVAGEGKLGGTTITSPNASVSMSNYFGGAAQTCGTFNSLNYFVSPSPFYSISLNSSISGSGANLSTIGSGPPNATLNGVVADINFVGVPEPSTLLLFGSGLLGLGMFARRRRSQA